MEKVLASGRIYSFEKFESMRQRSIGRLLWRLKRHVHLHIAPLLEKRGYTDIKMSSISLLVNIEEEGITSSELAKKLEVTKQAMSKAVKELEETGYVYSCPSEKDARASIIFLGDRGKEFLLDLNEEMQGMQARFEKAVSAKKYNQMVDTMCDLLAVLDAEE